MDDPAAILTQLTRVIEDRKTRRPEGSYTTVLLDGGPAKIRKKLVEEAAELFEAAGLDGEQGSRRLVAEAADLVYHLLVLLASRDVTLADVAAELARREGISGLDEKAARGRQDEGT